MASSYTTGFSLEKIGSGEQSGAWGDTTNFNWDIVDRLAAYKAVALSGTTHTLTVREASPGSGTENLQDGMYRVIKFTGALVQWPLLCYFNARQWRKYNSSKWKICGCLLRWRGFRRGGRGCSIQPSLGYPNDFWDYNFRWSRSCNWKCHCNGNGRASRGYRCC